MVRRRSGAGLAVAAMIAATVLSACGSSTKSSGGTPAPSGAASSSAGADSSLLGADNPATGEAVKVGFAYDGRSANIDNTNELLSAQAVVKYANAKLGGIGGRPIQLVPCSTNADPATDCGSKLVKAGVIAVVGGELGVAEPVVSVINKANIPYIDSDNSTPSLFTSQIDFVLTNPLVGFGGLIDLTKAANTKQVAFIVIDISTAVSGIKQIVPLLFGKTGITTDITAVPIGTADMTPQLQAASAKKPGVISITGNAPFCAAALKAVRTLNITATIAMNDACIDKAVVGSIPGGFKGVTVYTPRSKDPADPETKLFDAVQATYGDHRTIANIDYVGYQAMLGFIRGANSGKIADFTPAGVIAAMRAMSATPLPLGQGGTFKCDGTAIAIIKPVCGTSGVFSTATADGELTGFKLFDNPAYYKIG
jgi:branched-chain amino acid transport system substrate-binding protein